MMDATMMKLYSPKNGRSLSDDSTLYITTSFVQQFQPWKNVIEFESALRKYSFNGIFSNKNVTKANQYEGLKIMVKNICKNLLICKDSAQKGLLITMTICALLNLLLRISLLSKPDDNGMMSLLLQKQEEKDIKEYLQMASKDISMDYMWLIDEILVLLDSTIKYSSIPKHRRFNGFATHFQDELSSLISEYVTTYYHPNHQSYKYFGVQLPTSYNNEKDEQKDDVEEEDDEIFMDMKHLCADAAAPVDDVDDAYMSYLSDDENEKQHQHGDQDQELYMFDYTMMKMYDPEPEAEAEAEAREKRKNITINTGNHQESISISVNSGSAMNVEEQKQKQKQKQTIDSPLTSDSFDNLAFGKGSRMSVSPRHSCSMSCSNTSSTVSDLSCSSEWSSGSGSAEEDSSYCGF